MRRVRTLFFLLVLCPWASARGHIEPVFAVQARLSVRGDQLRADLTIHALNWAWGDMAEEITSALWPAARRDAVAAKLNELFPLTVEGRPLTPRLLEARYAQWPWQGLKDATVRVRLAYSLPPDARAVAGRALFGAEAFAEPVSTETVKSLGIPREFWADVEATGRVPARRRVPVESPAFSFPMECLRLSPFQRGLEALSAGAGGAFASGPYLLILAAALLTRPGLKRGWALGALGVFFLAGLFPRLTPPPALSWAGLALMGSVPWLRPERLWGGTALVAAGLGGLGYAAEFFRAREGMVPPELSRPLFLLGGGLALAGALLAAGGVKKGYVWSNRHWGPESLAAQSLFHRRLTSSLLAALGLFQALGFFLPAR